MDYFLAGQKAYADGCETVPTDLDDDARDQWLKGWHNASYRNMVESLRRD